ncbi:MAG: hypothetical protein D6768_00695 [Chloroflexi bacterium]|nr:MAG: hypothetical protein D6768_00695 [Chloroflexota bacterium]
MLQYLPLLLSLIILGATAYLYLMTRKMIDDAPTAATAPLPPPAWVQDHASVTKMAQDVAELVTELQAVADVTRHGAHAQRDELQAMLQQVETAATELRSLLARAEALTTAPASAPEPTPISTAPAASSQPAPEDEPLVPLELVYSPSNFGEYLRISGCGHDVVSVAVEHAQEFVIWYTNQFNDQTPPGPIEAQHLEDYLQNMESLGYDPDTIKRRFIALKAYISWVNNILEAEETPVAQSQHQPQPAAPPTPPVDDTDTTLQAKTMLLGDADSAQSPAAETAGSANRPADKFSKVFSLADEGLDQLAIAARTGLEQEAVRMLLAMGRSAFAGPGI